jgi:hypothetical protein
MDMKIGELVSFHKENFFEGAVQLRWIEDRPSQAQSAAEAFVFHGPRYHGAGDAESEGIEGGYRLKDSASFVRDLFNSLHAGLRGEDVNPYWLVVAGYGSGKSHLALTCATLLANPQSSLSNKIVEHISQADEGIGQVVQNDLAQLEKPALVLTLDGMAGFHLGNALSQAVLTQLSRYGVDSGAIRALSPRFQSAEQFVERNFAFRSESFAKLLHDKSQEEICARLRENDEAVYSEVDAIYTEANGAPIPVVGQESAQELINTLSEIYCGPDGAFSSVVILFDEFGRYLEYVAEKPLLAGDAALQQIFQGVQDNSSKIRFIGFIQYELKAYLKRFGSADLRQLQRYITRFDSAQKWYLSTNLETIFAHMIGKDQTAISQVWMDTGADRLCHETWQRMSNALPEYSQFPVWSDAERFNRVIAQGCWPLHPLATWFLTRQRDVVQSRSAMTFINEMIERVASEAASSEGRLRQVSAAELILSSMLPEMIAAEHQTGSTVAETLQLLLEKFSSHLSDQQRQVLAGVAVLEKMRVGKQSQDNMDRLLCEATAHTLGSVSNALQALSQDLGAIEWNRDLGQYELIADASTRGQFQQWLRKQQDKLTADAIRDLFVRRGAADAELSDIATDFALQHDISTQEWRFEAQFAHSHVLEKIILRAFQEWEQGILPSDAKGKVVYFYIHPDEDISEVENRIDNIFAEQLKRSGYQAAPIWVIGLFDDDGNLAGHIGRLHLFDEQMSTEERERFRRFVPEEIERSRLALKDGAQEAIKKRLFWIAGFDDIPAGRLKHVGNGIFSKVYPHVLPFPFDGFATTAGGGAADCAQLTRNLVAHQVDGTWLQAQPKRLQNRVTSLLVRGWKTLASNGKLTPPLEPKIKAVFELLEKSHQEDSRRTLWDSYKQLIAPPYGMNAASAGLFLGLVVGGISPPRRIELNGEMIASSDWVNAAFPAQRGKHFLEKALLEKSTLRFLSEDAEGRWRSLLNRWELAQSYQDIVNIAQEAAQAKKIDPLPESLEGTYLYLNDRALEIRLLLNEMKDKLEKWELRVEKAEKNYSVGELLNIGTRVFKERKVMEDERCWPEELIRGCDVLLAQIQPMLSGLLNDWIPRQSCHSTVQVSDFRHQMERAVDSLNLLGFKQPGKILQQQAQHSIAQVEARQKFALTLDESEDYPRQPEPTESTTVRDLRDAIGKGDEIVKGLQSAHSVLSNDEINARVKAIESRQNRLRKMLNHQTNTLGELFSIPLESEEDLRRTLVKANRLRDIFVGTADENEISDMVTVLERILANVAAWGESKTLNPERLGELLNQQTQHQLEELISFLDDKEIEPAWDLQAIYKSLVAERINTVRKRSSDWLSPRMHLVEELETLDLVHCADLEKELIAAPSYLSYDEQSKVANYLEDVRTRCAELTEELRLSKFEDWQQQFLSLEGIDNLTKYESERLLKSLNNPPVELTKSEQESLQSIEARLTSHIDQISMDDILDRIEKLPMEMQRNLIQLLSERLSARELDTI